MSAVASGLQTALPRADGASHQSVTTTLTAAVSAVRDPSSPSVALNPPAITIQRVAQHPEGLREHVSALLSQEGIERPLPPNAAWKHYRAAPPLCERLAAVIAARADRNYLVAALAADPLSKAAQPLDPAVAGFDPSAIPSGVGEALTKYLDQLPEESRVRTRGLLTTLAYARGAGIDDRLWQRFSTALGYFTTGADLDQLRQSAVADYLLESRTDTAGRVTRLFHQALSDELLASRDTLGDEQQLLKALKQEAAETGWTTAPPYLTQHAAEHATAAKQLASLLDDSDYIVEADYTRLLPLLASDRTAQAAPAGVLLRQIGIRATALPSARRRSLLALTAAHLGIDQLRRRLIAGDGKGFQVRWAHSLGRAHQELSGHTGSVNAVAIGRVGEREVIVSGSDDQTVRVWDAGSGQPLGEPLTGHTGSVYAVAVGRVGEREVIVSGSFDQTVRVWDAGSGQPLGEPLTGHTRSVTAVAIGRVGEREVIVSGSGDQTVRVWDAGSGQPLGEPLTGHTNVVSAVAIGRVGEREVIVSGSRDQTVRVWDAADMRCLDVIDLAGPAPAAALDHGGLLAIAVGRALCVFAAPTT